MATRHPLYLACQLDLESDEIRLLQIRPGTWDAPIICNFLSIPLSDKVPYKALSYVWGTGSNRGEISIDGYVIPVTRNLFEALRRLRAHSENQHLVIWVDAVCIDQSWTPERNHQVGVMKHIYSQCQEVIIWFGEMVGSVIDGRQLFTSTVVEANQKCYKFHGDQSDYDRNWHICMSDFTFRNTKAKRLKTINGYVPNFSKISLHSAWLFRLLASDRHILELPPLHHATFLNSTYYSALTNVLVFLWKNDWFFRLWVVQEAILAPQAQICFGGIMMPRGIFEKAQTSYEAHNFHRWCSSPDLPVAVHGFCFNLLN